MIRLNVRCCCVPVKVLGTLPVFEKDAHVGARLTFPVMKPRVHAPPTQSRMSKPISIDFTVEEVVTRTHVAPEMADVSCYGDQVKTEVMARAGYVKREVLDLALRHDGITLETLRRIPGFIEASHG